MLDLAACNTVSVTPQRHAVRDRDQTDPIGGDVDGIDRKIKGRLVGDVNRGVPTGDPELAVTRAENLAGDVDLPTLGHDRVEHDHALVGIEESVDRSPPIITKTDALAHLAKFVGKVHRLARVETLVDLQRDAVESALDQAVEVEIAGVDVDRAHREHARTRLIDCLAQRQQLRRAQVGKTQDLRLAISVVDLLTKGRGEVDVLARIGTHVQPVLGGQIKIACGRQGHRASTNLAADIDAALLIGQNQLAILVDDTADHIQVLWRLGHREATQVVIAAGISVLDDADHAVAGRACGTCPENRVLVEVHRAGGQGDECAVDHVDTAVLADADVVNQQAEQGVVDHRDLGLTVGLQATRIHSRLDRLGGIGVAIGADKDRARR